MWLASMLVINTLTLLTIAHADRVRPTLKDGERFRNGLVRDLEIRTLKCTRSNILYKNSCLNVSLNRTGKCCSNPVRRSTNNVLGEVNLQVTGIKHVLILPKGTQHMNTVWKYVKCIEVTVIFFISFIFACIVYCGSNIVPNKVDAIQQCIVSSSVYLLSLLYAQSQVLSNRSQSTLPLDKVIVDINSGPCSKSETLATKECTSRYAKFIVIEVRCNRHVG